MAGWSMERLQAEVRSKSTGHVLRMIMPADRQTTRLFSPSGKNGIDRAWT